MRKSTDVRWRQQSHPLDPFQVLFLELGSHVALELQHNGREILVIKGQGLEFDKAFD